jgi:hypothetical protein
MAAEAVLQRGGTNVATITIYGDSPGAPSPAKLSVWDEDFQVIDGAVTRTSGYNDDPTRYSDPNNAVGQGAAESIVGPGWHVTIA